MLPSTTKKQLYNALVLPHMEFCSVVWQECSREVRQKLERVQNYGMHRCVLKEYSMDSLSKRIQFNSNGTRGVGKLFLPGPQTDFFRNSVTFMEIQDWNHSQSDVRTTINYNTFRKHLRTALAGYLLYF